MSKAKVTGKAKVMVSKRGLSAEDIVLKLALRAGYWTAKRAAIYVRHQTGLKHFDDSDVIRILEKGVKRDLISRKNGKDWGAEFVYY